MRNRTLVGAFFSCLLFDSSPYRAGIVTIEVPQGVDAQKVFTQMTKHSMTIALRQGNLRFAPHFYNTPGEIDSALAITRECLT